MSYREQTTITSASDFPNDGQAHFCVLEFFNVFIPGDERSRTHPGHGYPDSTESHSRLIRFDTQEALEEWLLSKRHSNQSYIVLTAQRVSVVEKVTIQLKD